MPKLTPKLNPASAKTSVSSWWQKFGTWADSIILRVRTKWPQLEHRLITIGSATTIMAGVVFGAAFLWPDNINYSHSKQTNCINNPVLLPRLLKSSHNESYELEMSGQRAVLGYPIYAAQTCATLKQPLISGEQQLSLSHTLLPFAAKKITIPEPVPVSVKPGRPAELPLSTAGAIVFHLSSADFTHDYRLSVNEQSVVCAELDYGVLCNLDKLNLKQDNNYNFHLERLFRGESIGAVYEQNFKTVEPVRITKSSIKPGQTVQNIPTKITLTASKSLANHGDIHLYELAGDKKQVETAIAIDGKTIELTLTKPLTRRAKFELVIDELTASDGGYLIKPYSLKFSTSGGPRVSGVNIGSYGVSTYQSFVLWLDSEPKSGQKLSKYVSVNGFDYSLSLSGRQITITPNGAWPRCRDFIVTYKDGLKNRYGVSGGSAWSFNSRTLCQQVSSIGNSVDGRGIYAYRFGSGAQKILFVGGTHGDEPSSVYLLNSWIDHLEASYRSIPSDKTIIVVANINPDGFAAGRRTNAKNIDLNRNFPANNWKKDVIMPGGSLNKGGGGKNPLDQPESSAIANYTLSQNPKLVLTYHAVGSMVIANESGNSGSLAQAYGQYTGFWALNNSEIGGVFSHDTTGAYEDWLHDKHGIPALLIELSSYSGNEFWRHQSAMRAMSGF